MTHDKRPLHSLPISRLFPNMITLIGLCCGLSAIRYSLDARWELVVVFLMACTIIDGLDGRVARALNSTSTFGAQLDSLSDFLSFGVAPAMVIYMWTMHDIKRVGWGIALIFASCCALRLARFNTALFDETKEMWRQNYFVGIPAPAGAMLAMLPMVATFQFGAGFFDLPAVNIAYMLLVAFLMVSRIPTISIKHIKITHNRVLPAMVAFAVLMIAFLSEPWASYCFFGVVYLALIPFTTLRYLKHKRESAQKADA